MFQLATTIPDHITLAEPESVAPWVVLGIAVLIVGIIMCARIYWDGPPGAKIPIRFRIAASIGAILIVSTVASFFVTSSIAGDRSERWDAEVADWLVGSHSLVFEPGALNDWRNYPFRSVTAVHEDKELVEVTLKNGPNDTLFLTSIEPQPATD
jgi:hypothetical protein